MMSVIKSTFCDSRRSPEYDVVKTQNKAYEERMYNPSVWVSTSTIIDPAIASDNGTTAKKDENEPCCKLFGYIQGQNEGNHYMDMTFPVINDYTTENGPKGESKRTLSFFVPREFEEKTPLPTDPDIYINQQPAMTVYAMKFGGFANDEKCLKEKEKFMAILEADGVKVKRDAFYCAFYNTPLKLFNRKNEIWLVKEMKESKEQPFVKSPTLDVEREQ
ncbi:heme-binding protein 2 [Strongylocentrotus purpuratus]|uniref:Heme-binding protein 2 n=1 Tax=Strongylocentrotus purpuratus TaxID=7668 RepID=A0A7M7RBN2_STRPU|nr:heme-binding protein 2 [Strongylocentrotus purpuratus]